MTDTSITANRKTSFFLSAIDLITLIFCGWILLYMCFGITRSPEVIKHIPVYLAIFVGVLFLAWLQKQPGWSYDPQNPSKRYQILSFFRGLYPVLLLLIFILPAMPSTALFFGIGSIPFL